MRHELVMPFGDAQYFVYRFDPRWRKGPVCDNRSKDGAKRFAETQDPEQNSVDSLGFGG